MFPIVSAVRAACAATVIFAVSISPALAQSSATNGSVRIVVVDSVSHAVPGASATLQGPTSQSAATDNAGAVTFASVVPGVYTLSVSKSGFQTTTDSDVLVAAGQSVTVDVALPSSTFSTLNEIGRVRATAGRVSLNRTSASITTVPAATFTDQGQTEVTQVLQQVPGLSFQNSLFNQPNPGGQFGIPVLRGALPYETSVLIDGHPIAVGNSGNYDLSYLTPYVLQSVEVVKGPSPIVPTITNGVGGSINFRTLEPTPANQAWINYGLDSEQGSVIDLKATGTVGRLGYALDYSSFGSPGAYKHTLAPMEPFFGGSINGMPIAQSTWSPAPFFLRPGFLGSSEDVSTIIACCGPLDSQFQLRDALAKLRWNIGGQTTLTASYLYGSSYENLQATGNYTYPQIFAPGPGYAGNAGPYPAGLYSTCCEEVIDPNNYLQNNTPLFQGELSTAFGPVTLLARYYSGSNVTQYNVGNAAGTNYPFLLWGSAYLGAGNGTLTYFNGTPATYTSYYQGGSETVDKFGGFSVQAAVPVGPNTYEVVYDHNTTRSSASSFSPGSFYYTVPPGSSQQQQTITARGQFALSKTVKLTLSDYLVQYTDNTTVDSGLTFQTFTHNFNGVRLGTTWQPSNNVSLRLSAGSSIVPPYLKLVSQSTNPPTPNSYGSPTYFTQSANSPDIKPETGFGYDAGGDLRLPGDIVVSGDVYFTHLQNQFLTSQYQNGTYTGTITSGGPSVTLPLYITSSQNLGNSIYEGAELSIKRAPATGFGFTLQGSIQRAFAYHLPAGFYSTAAGPYTTNLGIVEGANFCGSSNAGYNGLGSGCIPYFQGYEELNYQTKTMYYRVGLTNFGANNVYGWPGFSVLSASVRAKLTPQLTATLSGDNLNAQHANGYLEYFLDGAALPLANGQLGFEPSWQYGPEIVRLSLQYKFGPH